MDISSRDIINQNTDPFSENGTGDSEVIKEMKLFYGLISCFEGSVLAAFNFVKCLELI